MATVTVTSSPTTLDTGSATTRLIVDNRGPAPVTLSNGTTVPVFQARQVAITAGTPLTATAPVNTVVNVDGQPAVALDADSSGHKDSSVTYSDLAPNARSGLASSPEMTGTYVPKAGPAPARRRDFPMLPPRVLSSPPATAAGASGNSVVAGALLVSAFEPGAFAYLGGRAVVDSFTNPNPVGINLGAYPQITSPSPVTVEFWLDSVDATGRFEAYWSGPASVSGMRVAIQQGDGSWGYVSAAATFSHSNSRADLVTLGAAGTYCIRLEFAPGTVFHGVYVGPTDTVTQTFPRKRYIAIGDSFTEPTLDESGSFVASDGWVQQLGYLTGYDIWSAGSGGTGYINPNSGGGRVKFRDRLAADVLAFNPDGIIWAGGINDPTSSYAAMYAEALACFQQAKAAGVADQVVLAPFWPSTLTDKGPAWLTATNDGIRDAVAAAGAGVTFLPLLELPDISNRFADWQGSTLQASTSVGGTSISVASIPAYMQVAYVTKSGLYVRIGTGTTTEIRRVSNITGTGPYTLTVTALSFAHSAGNPVTLSGPQYMTGSGKQGATTGSGNSDRYTGNGGTHPTKAGHLHIARTVATLWARSLAG